MPLLVVSTPIGNLEDMTQRALRVLRECDLIAAEDTRVAGRLLQHFGIERPLVSCHEQNERQRLPRLLDALREGKTVALITSAGTPTISDPGFPLVRASLDAGIPVVPVPGPTAHVAALVASGLPVHEFWFRGFPPRKPGKRRRFLAESAESPATMIFYESPYRILDLIEAAIEVYGNRRAALCREMTKLFEEFVRGNLSDLLDHVRRNEPRGEFVLVIEGRSGRAAAPAGAATGG